MGGMLLDLINLAAPPVFEAGRHAKSMVILRRTGVVMQENSDNPVLCLGRILCSGYALHRVQCGANPTRANGRTRASMWRIRHSVKSLGDLRSGLVFDLELRFVTELLFIV